MIFTLSGRQPIDVLKSTLTNLKSDYMINNSVMDDDSKIELLENILDLEIIIEKMEKEQND